MGKPVAVEGNTVATASVSTFPAGMANLSGSWTAGAVEETSYAKLTVNGTKVIHEARCTFSYSGRDTSTGVDYPTTSTVTLRPDTTILQKGNSNVLVHGNSAGDEHGNRLMIVATGHLTTA